MVTASPPAPATTELVDELLTLVPGQFEGFYGPLLSDYLTALEDELVAIGDVDIDVAAVLRSAGVDHLRGLITACMRTLLYEFRARTSDDADFSVTAASSGNVRYDAFHSWLRSGGREQLLREYPVLADDIAALSSRTRRALLEAVRRFATDRQYLAGLCPVPGRLDDVGFTDGDTHNGGRRVLVLTVAGERVVYKPRSLASDRMVTELSAVVNRQLEPVYRMRFPRFVDRGTHGWQEFIAPRPCRDDADVDTYFRRLGSLLAFFTTISCGDLHYENLVADGPDPVFFDLETFAHRGTRSGAGTAAERTRTASGDRSVLATMILPFRTPGSRFDMNMSGLGALGDQVSSFWTSYEVRDPGTDDFRLERTASSIRHDRNLVRLADTPVDPGRHEDAVADGVAAGNAALAACADEFTATARHFDGHLGARQVVRATSVYARFLEAASHPQYLRDPAARAELFTLLGANRRFDAPHDAAVAAEERRALLAGDVPYFQSGFDDRHLVANESRVIPEVYRTTLRAEFVSRLNIPDGEPRRARDRQHVRLSFLSTEPQPWTGPRTDRGRYLRQLFAGGRPDDVAGAIGDWLARTAVWSDDRALCVWLSAVLPDDEGALVIGCGRPVLYEDGGTLIFLADLARTAGDGPRRELANAAAAGMLADATPESWRATLAVPDSAFVGVPSIEFVAAALAAAGVTVPPRDRDEPSSSRPQEPASVDLLGGAAGLLALPGTAGAASDPPAVLLDLADELIAGTTELPFGRAHGSAGIALGLARAGDGRVPALVEQVAADVHRALDAERPDLSWCTGVTGALAACGRALRRSGLDATAVDARLGSAVERTVAVETATPVDVDLSLCHGMAGRAAAWLDLAEDLDSPRLRTVAEQLWSRTLHVAAAEGWSGGLTRSHGLTGYFLGLSGVGHVGLRLADPSTPAAWNLELGGERR